MFKHGHVGFEHLQRFNGAQMSKIGETDIPSSQAISALIPMLLQHHNNCRRESNAEWHVKTLLKARRVVFVDSSGNGFLPSYAHHLGESSLLPTTMPPRVSRIRRVSELSDNNSHLCPSRRKPAPQKVTQARRGRPLLRCDARISLRLSYRNSLTYRSNQLVRRSRTPPAR